MKAFRRYCASFLFTVLLFSFSIPFTTTAESTELSPSTAGEQAYDNLLEDLNSHVPKDQVPHLSQSIFQEKRAELLDVSKNAVEFIEVEPNDSFPLADVVTTNFLPGETYHIYGTITNVYYDVDRYQITIPNSAKITGIGLWVGDYYNKGWEDDLIIALYDAYQNLLAVFDYISFSDGTAARYLEGTISPGTYYITVLATDTYGSLYVNEIYGISLSLEAQSYLVQFNSNGGSAVENRYVEAGSLLTKPTDPVKSGYVFQGWYKDIQLSSPWNFASDRVQGDTVLYAKWAPVQYTVLFNSNGGSTVSSQTVAPNSYVAEPQSPTKTGFTFGGWYTDPSFNTPWNFSQNVVTGNLTLYAKWIPLKYLVSFETFGGTYISSREQNYDTMILKPASPTLSGYYFDGWYTDTSFTTPWDFSSMKVRQDTTLYARWVEESLYDIIAGSNRYYTAAMISKNTYSEAHTVILASGANYPDALAGGPLAYILNAPMLLTNPSSLSKGTQDEILRLGAEKVIILGSTGAVSQSVENTLKSLGLQVERIAGTSRYSTSTTIANVIHKNAGNKYKAVLASGMDFADALAAGSYAAVEGIPIILTRSDRLLESIANSLIDLQIEELILVGGNSAVSAQVVASIEALGITVTRYSGANRYGTATEIGSNFFSETTEAVIANGTTFPDALAAVPLAAKLNAPIILANNNRLNSSVVEYLKYSRITHLTFVGGDGVVTAHVRSTASMAIDRK